MFADALLVDVGVVVETGTCKGVGTRRLHAALPPGVRLISLDTEPECDPIDGVTLVRADAAEWVPDVTLDGLFVDDGPGRQATVDNLLPFCAPGSPVFVHDADLGSVDVPSRRQVGRVWVGVA